MDAGMPGSLSTARPADTPLGRITGHPMPSVKSNKPLMRVLAGEAVWPPPVWLMRQAGRYLPEYRAIREGGGGFIARCTTPDLATEITLQPIRRFGMDGAILFSDILILPWAMGQDLRFIDGEGPVLPPIRDAAGLAVLNINRAAEFTAPVMETVRRVRAALPESCTLLGFAGSPFTVACYMVEGGGSRDFAAYSEPALFGRLIDTLVEGTIAYLSAQIDAGADAVMLFDTWAGVLPPHQFFEHVVRPTAAIVDALNRRYPDVKVIGFPRLAGTLVPDYVEQTGVDCVGLDTSVDAARIAGNLPETVAVQGNMDPIVLIAGGDALKREALGVRDALRGRPHIFNLGHGILPQTPPEHVADLVGLIRQTS
jgi:uroporphyrinogen decarboxylase